MGLKPIKLAAQFAAAGCLCVACAQDPSMSASSTPIAVSDGASNIIPQRCERVAPVSANGGQVLPDYLTGGDAALCWNEKQQLGN